MTRKTALFFAAATVFAAGVWPVRAEDKAHKLTTVSMRKMADSLHAVIAADRQAYAELIEQQIAAGAKRTSNGGDVDQVDGLPVHAQLLRGAAQSIQKKGAEFSYTLRGVAPINVNSGPQSQVEQDGLARVAEHPEANVYAEEELGGRSYFTAIYADRATLSSCVTCHNQHPLSQRRDFKEGDVMGAIVVRIPLEF